LNERAATLAIKSLSKKKEGGKIMGEGRAFIINASAEKSSDLGS